METKIKITLLSQRRSLNDIIEELINTEYPSLEQKDRDLVVETLGKISKKLPEEQIIKKARAFIEDVLEA